MSYPISRQKYCNWVGLARVKNVSKILRDLGFTTVTYKIQNHGEDIKVYDNSNALILVIEVTNWRRTSYMSDTKAKSVNSCLLPYECEKLLIVSFYQNYRNVSWIIHPSIKILRMGYQTQSFYKFYHKKGQSVGMRPNDYQTKKSTRLLLTQKLKSMGII